MSYEETADRLVARMIATFRLHPDAAELADVWGMLKVPGFRCDDLEPSAYQAAWAFAKAKWLWRQGTHPRGEPPR